MKCVLNASVNWVTTPDLLKLWGYTHHDDCTLCGLSGCTLHHILSNCKVALRQRRYNWRHDSVLRRILTAVEKHCLSISEKKRPSVDQKIVFVKEGEKVSKSRYKRQARNLLDSALDWQIAADFDHKQFPFPASICCTPERPDLVIWSPLRRIVILAELTCPAEEGIQNATNRKQRRYTDLLLLIRQNNWTAHLFTIEVGARGFVAKSTLKFLRSLGLSYQRTAKICRELSEIAARCSFGIYNARSCKDWDSKRTLLEVSRSDELTAKSGIKKSA